MKRKARQRYEITVSDGCGICVAISLTPDVRRKLKALGYTLSRGVWRKK